MKMLLNLIFRTYHIAEAWRVRPSSVRHYVTSSFLKNQIIKFRPYVNSSFLKNQIMDLDQISSKLPPEQIYFLFIIF